MNFFSNLYPQKAAPDFFSSGSINPKLFPETAGFGAMHAHESPSRPLHLPVFASISPPRKRKRVDLFLKKIPTKAEPLERTVDGRNRAEIQRSPG